MLGIAPVSTLSISALPAADPPAGISIAAIVQAVTNFLIGGGRVQ